MPPILTQSSNFCCKILRFCTPKNLRYFIFGSAVLSSLLSLVLLQEEFKLQPHNAFITAQPTLMLCSLCSTGSLEHPTDAFGHTPKLLPKLLPAFCLVWSIYNTQGLTWSRIYTRRWMKRPLRSSLWDMVCTLCLCLVALCVGRKNVIDEFLWVPSKRQEGDCAPHPPTPLSSPNPPKSFHKKWGLRLY